ncbi:MAG: cation:proton antiporter [Candidatus Micrarchaeota archaeon]
MNIEAKFLLDLSVVLIGSVIGGAIFRKFKLPTAVGMIIAGILLNPFTPGYVVSVEDIKLFSQLGAILLMFVLGLQFDYRKFEHLGSRPFILAGVGCLAAYVVGFIAAEMLGWGFFASLLLGAMFVSTSTTMGIKIQEELSLARGKTADIVKTSNIIDDLYGFLALSIIAYRTSSNTVSIPEFLFGSGTVVAAILIIFYIGIKFAPKLFDTAEHLFPGAALSIGTAFCLLLSSVVINLQLSPVIGAFLAGTILTSTLEYRDILKSIRPVRNLFGGVFFLSIGLQINPQILLDLLPISLFLTVLAIGSKAIASASYLIKLGTEANKAFQFGLLTGPRGEVILIISQTAVLSGLVSFHFIAIATAIVFFSNILSPILVLLVRSGGSFTKRVKIG